MNLSKRSYPKFIFKKDLVQYIINKLNEDYLHLSYTLNLESEIIKFIRSVEKDNLHLTEEGDLEISFNDDYMLKIHSKNGYQIEELI
jgi:hypothetical protein